MTIKIHISICQLKIKIEKTIRNDVTDAPSTEQQFQREQQQAIKY